VIDESRSSPDGEGRGSYADEPDPAPLPGERALGYPSGLRAALIGLPQGVYIGANRYDTDDAHVLHLWNDKGESFDIEASKS